MGTLQYKNANSHSQVARAASQLTIVHKLPLIFSAEEHNTLKVTQNSNYKEKS